MKIVALLMFTSCLANAEPLSVCEVLANLSELNGKQIQVRGAWIRGDAMRFLWAITPCERPAVRDGWVFADGISVGTKESTQGMAASYAEYRAVAKAHPRAYILATLTGRLEAPEHFEIWTDPWGVTRPRAFDSWYFPAQLRFWAANHFKAVPPESWHTEAESERRNHLEPKRVH